MYIFLNVTNSDGTMLLVCLFSGMKKVMTNAGVEVVKEKHSFTGNGSAKLVQVLGS